MGQPGPGARKRWRGDDEHRLPAQKVEPYRLWFEFLKLASKDPEIQIDKRFYQRWGSVDADFDDWWSAHWRDLFSVDIGVRVCGPGEATEKRLEGDLVLRIPLYQDKKRTLFQIAELLDQNGAGERLADMKQGQFHLSVGVSDGHPIQPSTRFLRNLSKVKLLMRFYRFWLEGRGSENGSGSSKQLNATSHGQTLGTAKSESASGSVRSSRSLLRSRSTWRMSKKEATGSGCYFVISTSLTLRTTDGKSRAISARLVALRKMSVGASFQETMRVARFRAETN